MGNAQSVDGVRVSDTTDASRTGAMPRSRSVRSNAHHMGTGQEDIAFHQRHGEPRYLPRGLDKAHNGIIMPRVPYGGSSGNGSDQQQHHQQAPLNASSNDAGDVDGPSPQWGWFLRTTPPTPEMYQNCRPPTRHLSSSDSSHTSTTTAMSADSMPPPAATHQRNPVFQGLQNKNKANPMGWSSVPL